MSSFTTKIGRFEVKSSYSEETQDHYTRIILNQSCSVDHSLIIIGARRHGTEKAARKWAATQIAKHEAQ